MRRIGILVCVLLGCGDDAAQPPTADARLEGFDEPDIVCPGDDRCETQGDGVLSVGVGARVWTPRDLSEPDLALFASYEELFTWDVGPNRKGRLRYWAAYAPSSSVAILAANLGYDAQGNLTINKRSAEIAGYAAIPRETFRTYFVDGNVANTRYRDYWGAGTNEIRTNAHYDARGLPKKIVTELQSPNLTIADQTRNVAGLVTKRRTNTDATNYVESNWTYDKLGRVTDQLVQRSQSPTQVARQTLTYFGNDDVKTLAHALGTSSRTFTYAYDLRHQITGVTTNTASYFGATYAYGAAGRFQSANQTRTITPTPPNADPRLVRNVNYVYGGNDPEQVTALTNVPAGTTYASYTYDEAGNQRTRSYPATNELFEYLYDGKNQLRRVTRKVSGVVQGSEEYWYDENGQRTQIVKRNASGTKTELIYFIDDVQAHYNGTGAQTKIYSHLSMGTPVARIERTSNTATSYEFQFHGLANNTLAAVAQNGTINTSFSYSPFGERLESTDGGESNQGVAVHKRRSNDKYEDDLSALAYYGVRYADKTLIGWTQSDPLFRFAPDAAWTSPRRASLYSFSLNNSLRYHDPDGRNALQWVLPALIEAITVAGPSAVAVGLGGTAAELDTEHPSPALEVLETMSSGRGAGPSEPPINPIGIGIGIGSLTVVAKTLGDPELDLGGNRGNRKGERGRTGTGGSNNPWKHVVPDPSSPTGWSKVKPDGKKVPSPAPPDAAERLERDEKRRRQEEHQRRKRENKKPEESGSGGEGSGDAGSNSGSDSSSVAPLGCGIECVPSF